MDYTYFTSGGRLFLYKSDLTCVREGLGLITLTLARSKRNEDGPAELGNTSDLLGVSLTSP